MEINDAEGRANYLQKLIKLGYPIHSIAEEDYSNLTNNEEGNLYQIVLASTYQIGRIKSYLRRFVGFYHNFGRSGFLVLSGNRGADYIFTR